jgi:hypothetical protein
MANQNIILPAEVTNGSILRKTPLNVRFDNQLIAPNIQIGELRWVVPVLGQALYDDFVADQVVEVFPPTEPKFNNVAYQVLWDKYLWKFDANACLWASVSDIGMQFGANGIYLNNTDTSENAGIKGIQVKQDAIAQSLIVLEKYIREYLCLNHVDFPLYDYNKNCGCDGLNKNLGSQKVHVVFTDRKRCRNKRACNCIGNCNCNERC